MYPALLPLLSTPGPLVVSQDPALFPLRALGYECDSNVFGMLALSEYSWLFGGTPLSGFALLSAVGLSSTPVFPVCSHFLIY